MTEMQQPNPIEALSQADRGAFVDALHTQLTFNMRHFDTDIVAPYESYVDDIILSGTAQEATVAAEIALDHTLHGNPVPEIMGRWNVLDSYRKSQQFIGIATSEPGLAHAVAANNIAGFHASNSSSLLGVLEHGILSSKDSRDRGIALGSGERTLTRHNQPPFISFADWRDPRTIANYANGGTERALDAAACRAEIEALQGSAQESAALYGPHNALSVNALLMAQDYQKILTEIERSPDSLFSRLITANFPVAYGIDISEYPRMEAGIPSGGRRVIVEAMQSSIKSEFAVVGGNVPPEDIPVITVPGPWVDFVRQQVQRFGRAIDVYPIEPLITDHTTF